MKFLLLSTAILLFGQAGLSSTYRAQNGAQAAAVMLPSPAVDVTTDYEHSFDFSTIKTFAVKIGTPWGNPLGEERAAKAVSDQLTEKGWTPADAASADALVVVHGATQDRRTLHTFYDGWGGYRWGGMGTATTTVSEYTEGTLLVDIFENKDKKLIFRGVARDQVSDKPEKNEKKLRKATEEMFKNFPPESKNNK